MENFVIIFFLKKGRGVSQKSTWLARGVSQKSLLGPQEGSKSPENWSTWFMEDWALYFMSSIQTSYPCESLIHFHKIMYSCKYICKCKQSVQVKNLIFFYFTQTLLLILVLLNDIFANYNRLLQSCWYEPLYSFIFIMQ